MTNRRNLIMGLSALAAWTRCAGTAEAQGLPPPAVEGVVKTLVGDATPIGGRISLDLPDIAENGNTVPYFVRVESPMSDGDYVKAVHLLAPANPHPRIGSFFFTPQSAKASISSRMRLAQSQEVVVYAEMSNGAIYTAKRSVKVTIGGCGG